MCLYPQLIKNRKYLPNQKMGGDPLFAMMKGNYMYPQDVENVQSAGNKNKENGKLECQKK